MPDRYQVYSAGSRSFPYGIWDTRHRVTVTAHRTFETATTAANDMNDEHRADVDYARGATQ